MALAMVWTSSLTQITSLMRSAVDDEGEPLPSLIVLIPISRHLTWLSLRLDTQSMPIRPARSLIRGTITLTWASSNLILSERLLVRIAL